MKSKSKGLGDSIAKVTKATGIEKVVKTFFGEDCGCEERKDRLNKMFPYKKVEGMDEEQQRFFKDTLQPAYRSHTKLGRENARKFYQLYNDTFHANKRQSSCASCNKGMYIELLKVYESSCTNDKE